MYGSLVQWSKIVQNPSRHLKTVIWSKLPYWGPKIYKPLSTIQWAAWHGTWNLCNHALDISLFHTGNFVVMVFTTVRPPPQPCTHTRSRARAHTTPDPPIRLKNIIGVHTLVHINHINYVLHNLENTFLYTDNIYETDTSSIIST